ncbi:antirestriction protein, partial [Escherichia coli]|uniref:antirestriction protein n=1 Tax=Escherichia coli TaxID=562 RepID=UPI0020236BED
NRAEMSPEAAGIAACLMTYSHHACRTECYAMTVHYYRLRDYHCYQEQSDWSDYDNRCGSRSQ